ncbi:hypothetical protein M3765_03715 [Streptomyces thermoviolaceus]|uniref:hypothetical protein n=1 Tax=Streptomyces thermoviolaceus TaxID=1952 RepID=UPI00203E2145|nr:hypothetical protein [Streptomyces thermoviolaceus]MCM3263157.1 hypothetical protein [Streptomyces thermoviolaceus]
MPADEVTNGPEADRPRTRSGARHAAPKRPLFTRFHMPAGKAMAMAAMPTAVIVGLGFTSSLALADSSTTPAPTAKSLTADEYQDCVAALTKDGAKSEDKEKEQDDASSASPTPSAAASDGAAGDEKKDADGADEDASAEPAPSASASASPLRSAQSGASEKAGADEDSAGTPSSPDSGSDDEAASPSATPSPSASVSHGGLLGGLGEALGRLLGKDKDDDKGDEDAQPTPSVSATPSASASGSGTEGVNGAVKDLTGKVTDAAGDTGKGTSDAASDAVKDVTGALEDAAKDGATASPSPTPSASASDESAVDPENCPKATDAEGGVDNTVPLADDPWYLDASHLLLKGADYKGIVQVRTADGTVKKVLKYVISDGTDIGDLHQTVKDKQAGKTYHVQAAKGSTSTIRGGETVMYTESISGNLLGLIPVTFDPDNPPPLNIPLIYFTKVHVVQAAQFGGNLHVPGMHLYTTDGAD